MIHLRKISIAAILIALSIILDIVFKQLTFTETMGFPYYSLPVVIGSIVLGPAYGLLMGISSDVISFWLFPKGVFSFWFIIAPALWGLLPGLFINIKRKNNIWLLAVVLLITHGLATAFNTLALFQVVGRGAALAQLSLRIMLMPVNVMILVFLIYSINKRLHDVYLRFLNT